MSVKRLEDKWVYVPEIPRSRTLLQELIPGKTYVIAEYSWTPDDLAALTDAIKQALEPAPAVLTPDPQTVPLAS
jgi:hypothetical protein